MNFNFQTITNTQSFRIYCALASAYFVGSTICETRNKKKKNNNYTFILKMFGCNILKSLVWPASLVWYGSKCIVANKCCATTNEYN